jgi:DNA recombination protein RmuC
LLALLKAISYGWSQEKLAQNAVEISSLGRQLYERLCTLAENFSKIGDGLKKTTNSYNATIGTLEGNLLPAARRFKSLGITTVKELQEIQISEGEVREITKPELLVNKENDDTPGM